MEQEQISFLSYLSGGIIFSALALVFCYLSVKKSIHPVLILPAFVSLIWQLAIAGNYAGFNLPVSQLLPLEICRYGAWITATLVCLQVTAGQQLPARIKWLIHSVWILALCGSLLLLVFDPATGNNSDILIWSSLSLSITGLVCVEQLYRNTKQPRFIKLLSVTIGALFTYDIYLFSHSLIFDQIDQGLWQARGAVNGAAALLMAIGALAITPQKQHTAKLAISRPIVFYTTSLTAAGIFLTLMAVGGYYVQRYGGRWGSIVQIIILFLAIVSIAIVFVSKTVQSRINVWINKNFFRHKYDYRVEWLRLINSLSQPTDNESFHHRALNIVASIFKSPNGALWLKEQQNYVPAGTFNLDLRQDMQIGINTAFCRALKDDEWVFSPLDDNDGKLEAINKLIPDWMYDIKNLWLVLPLLTEKELLGFIILTKPPMDTALNWEDLDLLKTVGRQIASYLEKHNAAEQLAESKQFDAFNKLTAFIMHDLKNLIAQQALVVENAAKHKENPAFVEDAIRTIDNSVSRMSTLLKKLQQNEPSEFRSLEVHKVLMEAVKKCQNNKPVPSLRIEANTLRVNADLDRLVMTLTHIIKNAQEATDRKGFVDVTLTNDQGQASITVEDNGIGMDDEFIRNRLFKPFVTTKSGKGMGIGVYQTKEYISSLGGQVTVVSTPDEGSTFTIKLPANNSE